MPDKEKKEHPSIIKSALGLGIIGAGTYFGIQYGKSILNRNNTTLPSSTILPKLNEILSADIKKERETGIPETIQNLFDSRNKRPQYIFGSPTYSTPKELPLQSNLSNYSIANNNFTDYNTGKTNAINFFEQSKIPTANKTQNLFIDAEWFKSGQIFQVAAGTQIGKNPTVANAYINPGGEFGSTIAELHQFYQANNGQTISTLSSSARQIQSELLGFSRSSKIPLQQLVANIHTGIKPTEVLPFINKALGVDTIQSNILTYGYGDIQQLYRSGILNTPQFKSLAEKNIDLSYLINNARNFNQPRGFKAQSLNRGNALDMLAGESSTGLWASMSANANVVKKDWLQSIHMVDTNNAISSYAGDANQFIGAHHTADLDTLQTMALFDEVMATNNRDTDYSKLISRNLDDYLIKNAPSKQLQLHNTIKDAQGKTLSSIVRGSNIGIDMNNTDISKGLYTINSIGNTQLKEPITLQYNNAAQGYSNFLSNIYTNLDYKDIEKMRNIYTTTNKERNIRKSFGGSAWDIETAYTNSLGPNGQSTSNIYKELGIDENKLKNIMTEKEWAPFRQTIFKPVLGDLFKEGIREEVGEFVKVAGRNYGYNKKLNKTISFGSIYKPAVGVNSISATNIGKMDITFKTGKEKPITMTLAEAIDSEKYGTELYNAIQNINTNILAGKNKAKGKLYTDQEIKFFNAMENTLKLRRISKGTFLVGEGNYSPLVSTVEEIASDRKNIQRIRKQRGDVLIENINTIQLQETTKKQLKSNIERAELLKSFIPDAGIKNNMTVTIEGNTALLTTSHGFRKDSHMSQGRITGTPNEQLKVMLPSIIPEEGQYIYKRFKSVDMSAYKGLLGKSDLQASNVMLVDTLFKKNSLNEDVFKELSFLFENNKDYNLSKHSIGYSAFDNSNPVYYLKKADVQGIMVKRTNELVNEYHRKANKLTKNPNNTFEQIQEGLERLTNSYNEKINRFQLAMLQAGGIEISGQLKANNPRLIHQLSNTLNLANAVSSYADVEEIQAIQRLVQTNNLGYVVGDVNRALRMELPEASLKSAKFFGNNVLNKFQEYNRTIPNSKNTLDRTVYTRSDILNKLSEEVRGYNNKEEWLDRFNVNIAIPNEEASVAGIFKTPNNNAVIISNKLATEIFGSPELAQGQKMMFAGIKGVASIATPSEENLLRKLGSDVIVNETMQRAMFKHGNMGDIAEGVLTRLLQQINIDAKKYGNANQIKELESILPDSIKLQSSNGIIRAISYNNINSKVVNGIPIGDSGFSPESIVALQEKLIEFANKHDIPIANNGFTTILAQSALSSAFAPNANINTHGRMSAIGGHKFSMPHYRALMDLAGTETQKVLANEYHRSTLMNNYHYRMTSGMLTDPYHPNSNYTHIISYNDLVQKLNTNEYRNALKTIKEYKANKGNLNIETLERADLYNTLNLSRDKTITVTDIPNYSRQIGNIPSTSNITLGNLELSYNKGEPVISSAYKSQTNIIEALLNGTIDKRLTNKFYNDITDEANLQYNKVNSKFIVGDIASEMAAKKGDVFLKGFRGQAIAFNTDKYNIINNNKNMFKELYDANGKLNENISMIHHEDMELLTGKKYNGGELVYGFEIREPNIPGLSGRPAQVLVANKEQSELLGVNSIKSKGLLGTNNLEDVKMEIFTSAAFLQMGGDHDGDNLQLLFQLIKGNNGHNIIDARNKPTIYKEMQEYTHRMNTYIGDVFIANDKTSLKDSMEKYYTTHANALTKFEELVRSNKALGQFGTFEKEYSNALYNNIGNLYEPDASRRLRKQMAVGLLKEQFVQHAQKVSKTSADFSKNLTYESLKEVLDPILNTEEGSREYFTKMGMNPNSKGSIEILSILKDEFYNNRNVLEETKLYGNQKKLEQQGIYQDIVHERMLHEGKIPGLGKSKIDWGGALATVGGILAMVIPMSIMSSLMNAARGSSYRPSKKRLEEFSPTDDEYYRTIVEAGGVDDTGQDPGVLKQKMSDAGININVNDNRDDIHHIIKNEINRRLK